MEFSEMIRERMDNWEREWAQSQSLREARRVGAVRTFSTRDWFDRVLIRASKGAEARRARRELTHNRTETAL